MEKNAIKSSPTKPSIDTMAGKKILKVKNLTKKYKDGRSTIVALNNVSFDLDEGDSMAIIGPSGSGKTTLLEIIAGLNKPTTGEVLVNNINVHKGSDNEVSKFRNQTLGFVFQMMHLQDYFNALENVTLPLIAAGVNSKEAKMRAVELIELVGLKDRMTHYPKKLSGGEMQRVAIARALVNNPKIIMADEPTGKLDRVNAENVMKIFDEINHKGVSVVLITHDEKIASRYRHILQLEHGKVVS